MSVEEHVAEFDKISVDYEVLCAKEGPEKEPYKFKYEARELVEAFSVRVKVLPAMEALSEAEKQTCENLYTECRRRMGVNYIMTEENQAGYDTLQAVLAAVGELATTPPADPSSEGLTVYLKHAINAMYADNYHSMLLAGWGRPNTALIRLRHAKAVYTVVTGVVEAAFGDVGLGDVEVVLTAGAGGSAAPIADGASSLFAVYKTLPEALHPLMDSVHALYTHTLFYLAQVQGNLHRPQRSSHYVEATLERQLQQAGRAAEIQAGPRASRVVNEQERLDVLDRVEWANNALRLADYYTKIKLYDHAGHCLAAAQLNLDREKEAAGEGTDMPESYQRAVAETSMHLGALYLDVLGTVYARVRNGLYGDPMPDNDFVETREEKDARRAARRADRASKAATVSGAGEDASKPDDDDPDMTTSSEEEGAVEDDALPAGAGASIDGTPQARPETTPLPFLNLLAGSPPIRVPKPESITDWEPAKDVFMTSQNYFVAAQKFFVLDGFVTEHVAIQFSVARLFKYLSVWESAPKRQLAMHQRRVKLLSPLLTQLNPTIYQVTLKEFSLSAAQAAQEVAQLRTTILVEKMQKLNGAWHPADIAKLMTDIDTTLDLFATFVRCYKDERCVDPLKILHGRRPKIPAEPLNGATNLDDGSVEAYLTALFAIARNLGKVPAPRPQDRVPDMVASLEQFKTVQRIAAAILPADSPVFKEELKAAAEFVELLPSKIDKLHRGIAMD